jgi:hypothetical protein
MQGFLSAYANVWTRRHGFCAHVFQGHYRAELVEDESYLWTVTRYVHLNPVRARLVERPEAWVWSSYPGYARRSRRHDWVAHGELLASWQCAFGASDSGATYPRYVTEGLSEVPRSPWREARHGWLLSSDPFVDRVRRLVGGAPLRERRRELRQLQGHSLKSVCDVVCTAYRIDRSELSRRGSRHPARAALAYLACQRTARTNSEPTSVLGVGRPESVPNLARRYRASLSTDRRVRAECRRLEKLLADSESRQ